TGDFTIGLSPRVDRFIALEPSRPMLAQALHRGGTVDDHIEWLAMSAEDYVFDLQYYSAVVAAEAFHWFDRDRVVPRIAASLVPEAHRILVERRLAGSPPWAAELRVLIREYSTNRDYVPYDTGTEPEARGLFVIAGRAQTDPVGYRQTADGYVESFHSRNGFSRARLQAGRAEEFDDKLKTLLGRYCRDNTVWLPVRACVVWGRPVAA